MILLESLVGDAHVDFDTCSLFSKPLVHLSIEHFQNDEDYENLTRFNKYELFDLVERLGLKLNIHVHNGEDNFSLLIVGKF